MSSTHSKKSSTASQPNMENASAPQDSQLREKEETNGDGENEDEKGQLDENRKGLVALIMFALSLAVFLSALDTTIITVALPVISQHFNSAAGYTWIGSAYLLANAASTPLWGKLADIFGRKPMLLLANFLFFVGSLIAALSVNIGMLISARAIQGTGGGGLLTLVDIAISDLFSLRTRGNYLGIIGGVWAIACAVGPIIGGAFTSGVSWRWCFYINLPLDGIAFFIILFFLKLKTPRTPIIKGIVAIDWLGTLTSVGGVLLFLFGLQYGGVTFPWSSATVICLLVFGIVLGVLFVIIEWRFAKYPIMPLDLFRERSNVVVFAVTFLHGWAFISVFYYLPLYFQGVRSATPLLSGVYALPSVLSTGLAAAATGAFIGAKGQYLPPIILGFVMLTLGLGLFINFTPSSGWAKIIIYQIIAGIGIGPNFQAPLVALQNFIAQRDIATATATFNFVRNVATAMSVIVGQVVFANQIQQMRGRLSASLNPSAAMALGSGNAAANVGLIDKLPSHQQEVAQSVFSDSLRPMWIMYTAFAAAALLMCGFIKRKALATEHQQAEFGLEAEEKNAAARKAEREGRARGDQAESAA